MQTDTYESIWYTTRWSGDICVRVAPKTLRDSFEKVTGLFSFAYPIDDDLERYSPFLLALKYDAGENSTVYLRSANTFDIEQESTRLLER